MVFMGTEKFPTENEWSSYLSERGGEDNGETHLETTTCYFDVQPEHLKSCLERFASFYACPLFNFDSAAREVQAIESEFQQAKTEDENRLYQLICHLVAEKHGPSHPCGRFSWGNAKSLQELPAAAGVDMRAALRAFHEEHYSSRLMTLAVLGQEDLDTLEAMVAEAFHDMPNRHRPRPTFGAYRQPFAAPAPTAAVSAPPEVATPRQQHEGSWQPPLWVRLEPLKEKRCLDLTWFVPSLLPCHRSKPDSYVMLVLGHEGPGSLLSALKAEGLAVSLMAGADEDTSTSLCSSFSVQVELTPQGLAKADRVVELVFAALGMLACSPPERWLFDEVRDTASLRFRYQENEPEIDYVRRLAMSLQRGYSPDETLCADVTLSDFEPHAITSLLGELTPRRVIAALSAARAEDEEGEKEARQWQSEPWFDARFRATSVSGARLDAWERAYAGLCEPPAGGPIALPPRNAFIPTDLALRTKQQPAGAKASAAARAPPSLVLDSERGKLFVKPDASFGTPKVVVSLNIELSRPCLDMAAEGGAGADRRAMARERLLTDVAARVVLEEINAELYAATLVGFSYELQAVERGFGIELHGFSHKLDRLLSVVCGAIRALGDGGGDAGCDRLALKRVTTQLELRLRNAGFAPGDLAITERLRCLEPGWFSAQELLEHMPEVTPEMVSEYVRSSLARGVRLVGYVGGNVAPSEAQALFDVALDALGSPPPLPSPPPLGRCVSIPTGARLVRSVAGRNPADENAALDLYWQLGQENTADAARLNLLEHFMFEPLFNELRTKQQLGYTVSCSARNTQGTCGFLIEVVSATHPPGELEARALAFVAEFVGKLAKMKPADYASNVRSAVANRLLADKTIEDVCSRFWPEIDHRQYAFERPETEAAAMRTVPQAEFVEWAEELLLSERAKRLKVVVQARKGPAADDPRPVGKPRAKAETAVDDPVAFIAALELVPRGEGAPPKVERAKKKR